MIMKCDRIILPSFSVIGLEGSTNDGEDFIQRLWSEANARFAEIASLVKKDALGRPAGIWGAMSDFSRSFHPWEENFTRGLYLAGVECAKDALPPDGWTKWNIPGFEYLRVECDEPDVFPRALTLLAESGLTLAGAVHDFTDPAAGKSYMLFPIRRL